MESLHRAAEQLLLNNVRRGPHSGENNGLLPREYVYVCPSPSVYPHQWLWDSCFHAIVMARYDGELAKAELETVVAGVRADGFIPHLTSWSAPPGIPGIGKALHWLKGKLHHANLTQPPVLAIALEEVYERTGDKAFLARLLPATKSYYRYLASHRDPDADWLVSIISPLESGMDHSPAYDEVLGMRKASALGYHAANLKLLLKYALVGWDIGRILETDFFSVEDLAFNCIYASGLRALARLCPEVDEDGAEFAALASNVENAIIARCYDPDERVFYSLYSKADLKTRVMTVSSLMPLLLEDLPSGIVDHLINSHLLGENSFWTDYPVPSVSVGEEEFCPSSNCLSEPSGLLGKFRHLFNKYQMVWRGPTWINTNWFIARGLRLHGRDDIADELVSRTVKMVLKSGFWEFYNPFTGEGLGAPNFGWSTLAVDMADSCGLGKVRFAVAS
ncbi:MAG: hypothetical protein HYY30_10795 [Chloroflexi bacterium]|nr:hypothetical protein [Chloroflexota bacterium]